MKIVEALWAGHRDYGFVVEVDYSKEKLKEGDIILYCDCYNTYWQTYRPLVVGHHVKRRVHRDVYTIKAVLDPLELNGVISEEPSNILWEELE